MVFMVGFHRLTWLHRSIADVLILTFTAGLPYDGTTANSSY